MKATITTLLAAAASVAMANAFTIDFNNLVVPNGTVVDAGNPLTIGVVGYGNVRFETTDSLVVANNHSNDGGTTLQYSLELDPGESVLVTFLGPEALSVNFDIIGIGSGETMPVTRHPINIQEYTASANGGDGGGVAAISWNAVPEPSSTMLITLGVGSLILRRRR
ncbi:MAG: PEP-CTERM sorting domain-containing protein [Akkermansiaceae bacterium]